MSKVVFRDDSGEAIGSIGAKAGIVSNAAKCDLFESLEQRGVLSDLSCGEFRGGAQHPDFGLGATGYCSWEKPRYLKATAYLHRR